MSEEYVRKDTFEATMREMREMHAASEARMERSVMEIRAGNETFKAEVRQELTEMKNEISEMKRLIWTLNDRIESSFKFFGWTLSIAGVLFAELQLYIALK